MTCRAGFDHEALKADPVGGPHPFVETSSHGSRFMSTTQRNITVHLPDETDGAK